MSSKKHGCNFKDKYPKAMFLKEIEPHAQTTKTILKLSSVHTSEEGGDETYMIIQ